MRRTKVGLLSALLAGVLVPPASAQDEPEPAVTPPSRVIVRPTSAEPAVTPSSRVIVRPTSAEGAGTATYSEVPDGFWGGYPFLRQDIGGGVEYTDGFTTLGWFQPLTAFETRSIFFIQPQVFATDDGDTGGNIVGGYRHYIEDYDRVYGAFGAIDTDETINGNRHDQFSIGVEALSQRFDFRANGYFPLSSDEDVLNNGFLEKAMRGGDVEIGFPLLDPSAFGRVRAYFGAYGYDSQEKDPIGARLRLEAHIADCLSIGAAFLRDDVNGSTAIMSVDLRAWNDRLPGLVGRRPLTQPRAYLPASRTYRIATERYAP